MDAAKTSILRIFAEKIRLEVPLFQRQYVWSREQQWEPLWEDIERKFSEHLNGRKDAPVHFLGAMVLDQKQVPTGHVEKRQIIDGQQRLITLQIILAAFRDFCQAQDASALAKECETFTLNGGMMSDPAVEKFKVWPTQLDRGQFMDVITSTSRSELETKHPIRKRKYARKPDPRPRMVEAYLFFYAQIENFFLGSGGEDPLRADVGIAVRLEECFQALKNSLNVVIIDLNKDDDAQVIFETLNARGEPLLPADLLRNYIFLRAGRVAEGMSQEALYQEYWKRFDDPFWRHEVKQGRLLRPRSDLFMQHFLASRQAIDIPIKHLFVEYKHWIEREQPFSSIREELITLGKQGDHFRRMIEPKKGDFIFPLVSFLDVFDLRTAYPLLLALLDSELTESAWPNITMILESYFLRRAICGLSTKNYNRVFLALTRAAQKEALSQESLREQLAEQKGESVEWPTDEVFRQAWHSAHIYHVLNNQKLVHVLKRINSTFLDSKMEPITVEGPLTVEHIMPQKWIDNWPLVDGSAGVSLSDRLLELVPDDDPRVAKTQARDAVVQTIGNLTILTQALNSAASNGSWEVKRKEIMKHSLLPINQDLGDLAEWDEKAIGARSGRMFERALTLWPR